MAAKKRRKKKKPAAPAKRRKVHKRKRAVASAPKKRKRKRKAAASTKKARIAAAMAAYSGESRHGTGPEMSPAQLKKLMFRMRMAEGKRAKRLSNPRRRVRKFRRPTAATLQKEKTGHYVCPRKCNQGTYFNNYDGKLHCSGCGGKTVLRKKRNPMHFPSSRKGKLQWWILDVHKGGDIATYIARASKADAVYDARLKLAETRAKKVELSGPYSSEPTVDTARK